MTKAEPPMQHFFYVVEKFSGGKREELMSAIQGQWRKPLVEATLI